MFVKNSPISIIFTLFMLLISSFLITGCLSIPSGSLYVTSNPSGAAIYLNGDFSGEVTPSLISNLSPGSYLLELRLEDPSTSLEENVDVLKNELTSVHFELLTQPEYRALFIGVDEYKDPGITDLKAPPYDVDRMRQVFENAHYGDDKITFNVMNSLIGEQATRSNILQLIGSTFSDADNSDVSYFYFSGHGSSDDNTSTLLPHDALAADASKDIKVDELASVLGDIPGIKIVIIDSCYSGGFIGKEFPSREISKSKNLKQINENVLESFSLYDNLSKKSDLASDGFKVITSAAGDQVCWETSNHPVDGNPYAYFSASLCEGCGYNDFSFPAPADSNLDKEITLEEIYQYINNSLTYLDQDVQVYPQNSSFVFIEY